MKSKKIGSLLLTAITVILILTATPVSAEGIYYWEQVSEKGFGDLANDYAWSDLMTHMAIAKPTVANSNISIVPLLVNKTVCDPKTHEWVDELNASSGDTLRFRCEVRNNETSELTNTLVWDFLSNNLKYVGDATVRYPSGLTVRREPDYVGPLNITNQTIGTVFIYYFPLNLKPSKNIIIEYNATVGAESGFVIGYKGMNMQFAGGYYQENGEWGFGYDFVNITYR